MIKNKKQVISTLIKDKSELNNDHCYISYEPFIVNNELSERPIVKLVCNHCFFLENIRKSYTITNRSGSNYIGPRLCPYCMSNGGYLPYISGKRHKGIHYPKQKKVIDSKLRCFARIKSGINIGKRCECQGNVLYYKFESCKVKKKIPETGKYITTIVKRKRYFCGKHKSYAEKITNT